MTESELQVESEKTSKNMLGEPGQRSEVGMAFGGSVGCRRAFTWFVAEKPARRLIFLGTTRAMVGVSSSNEEPFAISHFFCTDIQFHEHLKSSP